MAFKSGSWEFGGVNLPEFGLTESLFPVLSNKSSENYANEAQANYDRVNSEWSKRALSGDGLTQLSNNNDSFKDIGTGGTGGSNSGSGSSNSGTGTTGSDYDQQLWDQVNSNYSEGMSALNKQYSNLQNNKSDYYNMYTAPYEAQLPLIQQAGDQGVSALQGNIGSAQMQGQQDLNQARRLGDELSQRNIQAYGGVEGSSIGQAASEILGRSTSEQFGNIRQNISNTINDIKTQIVDVQQKTIAQINSIKMQKEQALSQAKIAFNDALRAIDNSKGMLRENKNIEKLNLLKEYRDRAYALEDYAKQLMGNAQAAYSQTTAGLQENQAKLEAYYNGEIANAGQNVTGSAMKNYAGLGGMGQSNVVTPQEMAQSTLAGRYNTKDEEGQSILDQVNSYLGYSA